jgi:hypothetical protein
MIGRCKHATLDGGQNDLVSITSRKAGVALGAFLSGSVLETWTSDVLHSTPWALIPPLALAGAVLLVLPGGLFERDGKTTSILNRIAGNGLLIAYLVVSFIGIHAWSMPLQLGALVCLAAAYTVLISPTLPQQLDFIQGTVGVGLMLMAEAFILILIENLRHGQTLEGQAVLVAGLGALMASMGLLDTILKFQGTPPPLPPLSGVPLLMGGLAFLLPGVVFLRGGQTLGGVGGILAAVAFLLISGAFWRDGHTVGGAGGLLASVAFALIGAAFLRNGQALGGVGSLLAAVSFILIAVAFLCHGEVLAIVGLLLAGVALLLGGFVFSGDGRPLASAAFFLAAVTLLLEGVALLRPRSRALKIWRFLTQRHPLSGSIQRIPSDSPESPQPCSKD